jgi:hypothetical protein
VAGIAVALCLVLAGAVLLVQGERCTLYRLMAPRKTRPPAYRTYGSGGWVAPNALLPGRPDDVDDVVAPRLSPPASPASTSGSSHCSDDGWQQV